MIDYFAIGLTHCLLALAALRLLSRPDLDDENAVAGEQTLKKPWLRHKGTVPAPDGEETAGAGDA